MNLARDKQCSAHKHPFAPTLVLHPVLSSIPHQLTLGGEILQIFWGVAIQGVEKPAVL